MPSVSGPRPIVQRQQASQPFRSFSVDVPLKTIDDRQIERSAGSTRISGETDGDKVRLRLPYVHGDIPTNVEVDLKPDGSFEFKKKVYEQRQSAVHTHEAHVTGYVRGDSVRVSFGDTHVRQPRYGAYDTDFRYGNNTGTLDPASPQAPSPPAQPATPSSRRASVDRDMWNDLGVAAASGQGITKGELTKIVRDNVEDGPSGVLTKSERAALARAVEEGRFARSSTADIAERIANGQGVSLLGIRTV